MSQPESTPQTALEVAQVIHKMFHCEEDCEFPEECEDTINTIEFTVQSFVEKLAKPKKKKKEKCTACNGTGRYDNNGSPPCGACNGTGKA